MLRRSSVFAAEVLGEVFDRTPTEKELVSQSKALCRDYINSRLNREGLWFKEQDSPASVGALGEVFAVLLLLGDELEYMRPYVYRNVAKQLNISVAMQSMLSDAFFTIATEIVSSGVTWGRVVAVFAVAGALAVDCVRQGQPAMVHTIVDSLAAFVRKSLAPWLKKRGGWGDISKCVIYTEVSADDSHWLIATVSSWKNFLKTLCIYVMKEF